MSCFYDFLEFYIKASQHAAINTSTTCSEIADSFASEIDACDFPTTQAMMAQTNQNLTHAKAAQRSSKKSNPLFKGKIAGHRRGSKGVFIALKNETYLRRLYVPSRLLPLLKICSKPPETAVGCLLVHCVKVYDWQSRAWDFKVETRLDRKHCCLARGWAEFCRHHNVRLHDNLHFFFDKVNGKQSLRVIVNGHGQYSVCNR